MAGFACLLVLVASAWSQPQAVSIARVHFLIPGGAGGGWDGTARGVGAALQAAGLVEQVSYENMSGAGGGKAMSYLLQRGVRAQDVLMVNSTPMVVRSLMPVYRLSWRDFTPVAAVIGDYGALMVRADSPYTSFADLRAALQRAPRSVRFSGGSTRGGLDHLFLASVFVEVGLDPLDARYVPFDAGGKATLSLLSGEVEAMSSSVGDAIALVQAGKVRVLGVSAPERLPELPDVPTFTEQGHAIEFVNWRGFFAVPGLPEPRRRAYEDLLARMMTTPQWEQVRARNGWINNFIAGDAFVDYLEGQEVKIGALMRRLGFIE